MNQKENLKAQAFVIDACIARSANTFNTDSAIAKRCRICLDVIRDYSFRISLNEDLKNEWDNNASPYAKRWLVKMIELKRCEIDDFEENQVIRQDIHHNIFKQKPEWKNKDTSEDVHLLESAINNDMRIISLDENARDRFGQIAPSIAEMKEIIWVNPTKPVERAIKWLKKGAPDESERYLGALYSLEFDE